MNTENVRVVGYRRDGFSKMFFPASGIVRFIHFVDIYIYRLFFFPTLYFTHTRHTYKDKRDQGNDVN